MLYNYKTSWDARLRSGFGQCAEIKKKVIEIKFGFWNSVRK